MNYVEYNVGIVAMAEMELAAFAAAVKELFGPEHAQRSVEDWIEELELMDWPAEEAIPDWRQVTIAAAARLAGRSRIKSRE